MKKGISPKFSSHSHDYNSNSHFMCHGTVVVQPSGKIKGIKPPPRKCKIGYQSECCKPEESYTTYKCSPSVSGKTKVVLTINSFQKGGEWQCDNNIVNASKAVWKALGVPNTLFGSWFAIVSSYMVQYVDESKLETETRILADIFEYDESSANESEDAKNSEGKSEGKSEEESEIDSGDGEDRRDSGDGEEDPLSLPICATDISVESYGLTT
ncbi:putative ripening-related protein 1-like [Capsicum annuum]|nr:putative ripening-related protein 1-like [Capsicum annuum]KAF3671302.1 putative ripening-related protein 1-like [Capsicum annuum]